MPARYPIVFFPGIMGSRLYFPAGNKYWDPDSDWEMTAWMPIWHSSDYLRKRIHVREPAGVVIDRTDKKITPKEADRGWGGVAWEFYGPFLQKLQQIASTPDSSQSDAKAADAFAVGYDWRQNLDWLGRYAQTKIRRILDMTASDKVILVTHSMGGLVVRSAFAQDESLKRQVAGVLYISQPTVGAVIMYRRLYTGMKKDLDGGGGLADRLFRLILGNTQAAFVATSAGLPGAIQLLPSASFPSANAGEIWHPAVREGTIPPALYSFAQSPTGLNFPRLKLPEGVRPDLPQRIAELERFHDLLKSPDAPATTHDNSWLIYGTDLKTETRIQFDAGKPVAVTESLGDEVVPSVSATALGLSADRMIPVSNAKHSDACLYDAVQIHAERILRIIYSDGPLAGVRAFGHLDDAAKARTLKDLEAPEDQSLEAVGPAGEVSFGLLPWTHDPKPWQHSGQWLGILAPSASAPNYLDIRSASQVPADPSLQGARIKVTLDQFRIASYPCGGTHRVLFDFSARSQLAAMADELHFNATLTVREGDAASVRGLPIFLGLPVGSEGIQFRCVTVNVGNVEDEQLLNIMESDAFRGGLQVGAALLPALKPLSAMAVGLTKYLVGRSRNVPVQDILLGLDFSDLPARPKLSVGQYLSVQMPDRDQATWDWANWAFRTSGQIVHRIDPTQVFPFNYAVFGISRQT